MSMPASCTAQHGTAQQVGDNKNSNELGNLLRQAACKVQQAFRARHLSKYGPPATQPMCCSNHAARGLLSSCIFCSSYIGHPNPTSSHLQALLVDKGDGQPRLDRTAHPPQLQE